MDVVVVEASVGPVESVTVAVAARGISEAMVVTVTVACSRALVVTCAMLSLKAIMLHCNAAAVTTSDRHTVVWWMSSSRPYRTRCDPQDISMRRTAQAIAPRDVKKRPPLVRVTASTSLPVVSAATSVFTFASRATTRDSKWRILR